MTPKSFLIYRKTTDNFMKLAQPTSLPGRVMTPMTISLVEHNNDYSEK